MRILIATEPDDTHALSVKLAVENLGHHCDLWFTADMPTLQTHNIYIADEQFDWFLKYEREQSKKIMNQYYDVIWWRRPRKPYVSEAVHQNDLACIKKENDLFYHSMPLLLNRGAWWINPYESIKYANSKIYQLQQAPYFNLKIPPTLISNSPENIKNFINHHKEVIYKPFFPHHWHENGILKFSYTQNISLEQMPSDKVLQMTPGIFQRQINKRYELRVTCFGEHLVAVKIHSQEHPKGINDWRVVPSHELKLELFTLPKATEVSIRSFMNHLGLVFGCFDFIVTPENEIYFLEVNQQGQFLWVEDILPEVRMLDTFIHFLLSKKLDFKWNEHSQSIKLNDYRDEVSRLCEIQISQHIYLNQIKRI